MDGIKNVCLAMNDIGQQYGGWLNKNVVKIQIGPDTNQAAVATVASATWMLCPVSWLDWNQINISN